jgi:hypothetical protein
MVIVISPNGRVILIVGCDTGVRLKPVKLNLGVNRCDVQRENRNAVQRVKNVEHQRKNLDAERRDAQRVKSDVLEKSVAPVRKNLDAERRDVLVDAVPVRKNRGDERVRDALAKGKALADLVNAVQRKNLVAERNVVRERKNRHVDQKVRSVVLVRKNRGDERVQGALVKEKE